MRCHKITGGFGIGSVVGNRKLEIFNPIASNKNLLKIGFIVSKQNLLEINIVL